MLVAKRYATNWIASNEKLLTEISDKIWDFAESGFDEFKSSALLADKLEGSGFKVERGIADIPTAFVATCGTGKPVIGIIGEYDALPGLSQKRVPWEEPVKPGKPGHGCGHNIYGASGMVAAIALKKTMEKHRKSGTIKFFGCPAEENFSAKVYMVRAGCFSNIDSIIGHHPSTMNGATLRSNLAINSIRFHFYGRSSHASASPEEGRSALDAVELMNAGVNYLREHVTQNARIHYVIKNGGEQPNIVPRYAQSWYLIRAPERIQVESICDRIFQIAKGAALMTGTSMRIEQMEGCYNLIPNKILSELVVKNMHEIGLPEYTNEDLKIAEEFAKTLTPETKIAELKKTGHPDWSILAGKLIDDLAPSTWGEGKISYGSSDIADVSWQTPTVEFSSAAWVLGTPYHSWQAAAQSGCRLAHKALIFGAKVLAATVTDLLTNAVVLSQAKEEHKRGIGDRIYKSPLLPSCKPQFNKQEI